MLTSSFFAHGFEHDESHSLMLHHLLPSYPIQLIFAAHALLEPKYAIVFSVYNN
jgi:hypothetical protein